MTSRDRTREWRRLAGAGRAVRAATRVHVLYELHVAAARALRPGDRDASRCVRAAAAAAANAVARADNAQQAAHARAVGDYVERRTWSAAPVAAPLSTTTPPASPLAPPSTARVTVAHERAQTDAFHAFERTRAIRGRALRSWRTSLVLTERVSRHVSAHTAPIERLEASLDAVEGRFAGARSALEQRAQRVVSRRTHLRCAALAVATCLFWTLLCL